MEKKNLSSSISSHSYIYVLYRNERMYIVGNRYDISLLFERNNENFDSYALG